nr:MAG TPA: hypothetical protein [Caudoviricetes sp.]
MFIYYTFYGVMSTVLHLLWCIIYFIFVHKKYPHHKCDGGVLPVCCIIYNISFTLF